MARYEKVKFVISMAFSPYSGMEGSGFTVVAVVVAAAVALVVGVVVSLMVKVCVVVAFCRSVSVYVYMRDNVGIDCVIDEL